MLKGDFRFIDHGTVHVLRLLTPAAWNWIEENVSDWTPWGPDGIVIEPRYVDNIRAGMTGDGLVEG